MKVEFKLADDYQLTELFKWFYDETPKVAEKFASAWVAAVRKQFADGVTMAELQQHFVDNMFEDCETCVNNLKHYDLPLLQKQAKAAEEKRKREAEEEKKKKKAEKKAAKAKANQEEAEAAEEGSGEAE